MNCSIKNSKEFDYTITAYPANSASPTDTWSVKYYKKYYTTRGSVLKDEFLVCNSFVKLWVSSINLINSFDINIIKDSKRRKLSIEVVKPEQQGLEYEAKVYKQIKNDIIDTNISHSFVEIIDFVENKTFNEIINFLMNGMPRDIQEYFRDYFGLSLTGTEKDLRIQLQTNLLRNTCFMLGRFDDIERPSIYDNEKPVFTNDQDQQIYNQLYRLLEKNMNDIRYSYIETKNLNKSIKFWEFINLYIKVDSKRIYKIFGKILIELDKLNSNNISHQDLHLGNIFIDPVTELFNIYDFDRSYSLKQGNNKLLQDSFYCEELGECNQINDIKDFVFLFCNFHSEGMISSEEFKEIIFDNTVPKEVYEDNSGYYNWFKSFVVPPPPSPSVLTLTKTYENKVKIDNYYDTQLKTNPRDCYYPIELLETDLVKFRNRSEMYNKYIEIVKRKFPFSGIII